MSFDPANPLIVQSDRTVLLETASEKFDEARDALSMFAELVKSPEHIHTYRITPLSLWNAASLGYNAAKVIEYLTRYGKYPVPQNLVADIEDFTRRYGRLKLVRDGDDLYLKSVDTTLSLEVARQKTVAPFLDGDIVVSESACPVEVGLSEQVDHAVVLAEVEASLDHLGRPILEHAPEVILRPFELVEVLGDQSREPGDGPGWRRRVGVP